MKIIVTGGAGFIGGNFVHHMVNKYPEYQIINLDLLTYAGNLETLKPVEDKPNYKFVHGDIADRDFVFKLFEEEKPDVVVNFAAESHVDRSITDPEAFVRTNVMGTTTLLDACRTYGIKRYHQVSTDEVYGDLPLDRPDLFFTEDNPASYLQPVLFFQGECGSVCTGIPQNLRTSGDRIPLLQQLRSISFSGEADSADDQPCAGRRGTSGIRRRRERPRLAARIRPL